MKPVGDRCYSCEFYPQYSENINCGVPQWIPKKIFDDTMKRIPKDCPARKKSENKN